MEKNKTFLASPRGAQTDLFTEEDIARYWRVIGWPVLATLALFLILARQDIDLRRWQEVAVCVALFVVVSLLARTRTRGRTADIVAVSALAGFLSGLGLAALRLTATKAFYLVFSLLTEPATTVVLGIVVGWLLSRLLRITAWPALRGRFRTGPGKPTLFPTTQSRS